MIGMSAAHCQMANGIIVDINIDLRSIRYFIAPQLVALYHRGS